MNNEGERIPEVYYWIISKNLQEEVIIKIDGGISAESYLFNTQYLSNDNKLYCLGYMWANRIDFSGSVYYIRKNNVVKNLGTQEEKDETTGEMVQKTIQAQVGTADSRE